MPQKIKHEITVPKVDKTSERLVSQHIDYIAKPGRQITKTKLDIMDGVVESVAQVLGDAFGLEVLNVNTERY